MLSIQTESTTVTHRRARRISRAPAAIAECETQLEAGQSAAAVADAPTILKTTWLLIFTPLLEDLRSSGLFDDFLTNNLIESGPHFRVAPMDVHRLALFGCQQVEGGGPTAEKWRRYMGVLSLLWHQWAVPTMDALREMEAAEAAQSSTALPGGAHGSC